MSGRSALYDAVVTALGTTTPNTASTTIRYVTRSLEPWWDWTADQFPGVRVIDKTEEKKPVAFRGTTDMMDMGGTLEIEVSGYVMDMTNETIGTQRSTLIADIERLVMTSTAVASACLDIWPGSVETDEGTIDGHGTCTLTFRARYDYNHTGP